MAGSRSIVNGWHQACIKSPVTFVNNCREFRSGLAMDLVRLAARERREPCVIVAPLVYARHLVVFFLQ
jgi:hypothetical protein